MLSGYFRPADNQLAHPSRRVDPFGRSAALKRDNTPDDLVTSLKAGTAIPEFWLGVGASDRADLRNAEVFAQLLQIRQPRVTLKVVQGGGHTMVTWRALMPPLFEWMTPRLFAVATAKQAREANRARKATQAHHKKAVPRQHT